MKNLVKSMLSFSVSSQNNFKLMRESTLLNLFQCIIDFLLAKTSKNSDFQVNNFLV